MIIDPLYADIPSQPPEEQTVPGNQAAVEILHWLLARRRQRLARQIATAGDVAPSAANLSPAESRNPGDAVEDSAANGAAN